MEWKTTGRNGGLRPQTGKLHVSVIVLPPCWSLGTAPYWRLVSKLRCKFGSHSSSNYGRMLSWPVAWTAVVVSCMGYLTTSCTNSVQRVQNAAACLICNVSRLDHITPTFSTGYCYPLSIEYSFFVFMRLSIIRVNWEVKCWPADVRCLHAGNEIDFCSAFACRFAFGLLK